LYARDIYRISLARFSQHRHIQRYFPLVETAIFSATFPWLKPQFFPTMHGEFIQSVFFFLFVTNKSFVAERIIAIIIPIFVFVFKLRIQTSWSLPTHLMIFILISTAIQLLTTSTDPCQGIHRSRITPFVRTSVYDMDSWPYRHDKAPIQNLI